MSKIKYYFINEDQARIAHNMNSYYQFKEGAATDAYQNLVDNAHRIAEKQKLNVDSMIYEKIDGLVNLYARRLAEWYNHGFEIECRCPSVMVAGPSNFPVGKKEKQNEARHKHYQDYADIEAILAKIEGTGTAGISSDDPNALDKLKAKLADLRETQEHMKSVNAFYRKHKTLDGCPGLSESDIKYFVEGMRTDWRSDPKPFEAFQLSNLNARIKQTELRISQLEKAKSRQDEEVEKAWGTYKLDNEDNRIQLFFTNGKPDSEIIQLLKRNAFKWSPRRGAWIRQISDSALYAAKKLVIQLDLDFAEKA